VLALLIIGLVSLAIAGIGFARRQSIAGPLRIPAGIVGVILVVSALLPTQPATPESSLPNPLPLTVDSIAAGADVYLNTCAACHGIDARGNGADAGTTPVRPPALTGPGSHLTQHSDGDLHYWISNGLPGGMPAWATRLSDTEIWQVINYLRSLGGAVPAASSSP
jgi:mono/diheme cytochrome c family protein